MDYQALYQQKLTTADEAVKVVKSGDWVDYTWCTNHAGEHFAWHSWHCSGIDRKIIAKGMGYFSPMRYSELPRFYREHLDPVDVVMLQVTPMDKHGNFNFGLACSHLADMLARARWTKRWPTWWCPRFPTVPACSLASVVCPTLSVP